MTVAFAQASPHPGQAKATGPCCPLCKAGAGDAAWTAPDRSSAAYDCAGCGLTYTWPRNEQDHTDIPVEFYYNDFETLNLDGSAFLFGDVSAAMGRRVALGFDREGAMPSILDAGCGAGQDLLVFRAHGWTVEGVDPWRAVTEIGRKYYRLPIRTARLEEARITPGTKDAVLALDVLQFQADPRRFLTAALAALRPGGLLHLTVPNHASADSRRDGWNHAHFSPLIYLSYFTAETIRRLLEEAGFYRVQVRYYGGPQDDERLRVVARRAIATPFGWPDLAEEPMDHDLPPLDRKKAPAKLTPDQEFWRENGYLILRDIIPAELIDRYCAVRRTVSHAEGWNSPTPYLEVPAIRDLCLYPPLCRKMEELMGEPLGLHLNLTGWVSTERDWHQDDYLNPPEVNGHYIAAWTALDQISPDAGPFEFVPGSHHWPFIRQAKVLALLGPDWANNAHWPAESERLLTPFFEEQIRQRRSPVERFLGNRGDVLLWHARLLHRGSLPIRPGAERRSMIAHYSTLTRRHDMPVTRNHSGGGWYFVPGEKKPDLMRRIFG